jgi:hypothetical protein
MTATFSKACTIHPGTKVIFEADDGRACPLCEAEIRIRKLREALSDKENRAVKEKEMENIRS